MNTVIITGRLTKDATLGQTKNGDSVAKFILASDKGRKSRYGDDPGANFIPVEIYGKKAGALGEYLKRGTALFVIGSLRTNKYKNAEGQTRTAWRVIGDKVEFLPPEGKMNSMNKLILAGRLTDDTKTSYTKDGLCIQEFTVACDRKDKEKNTDFIPVTLYGKLGESLGRYLVKGKSVTIDGRLDTGSFKTSDGTTVYTWKVIADEPHLNGSSRKAESVEADQPTQEQAERAEAVAETNKPDDVANNGFVELPPEFDEEYFDDEW